MASSGLHLHGLHLHVGTHEAGTPPPGGPVMIDIGDDVGALLVFVDDELFGSELHLRPAGQRHTTHTGVWKRELGGRTVTVAVYPALAEGTFTILDGHGEAVRTVTIHGGQVLEVDLRTR